jgi:hypothetical protein
MRTKRLIEGLNNSQKIRVIINGIGFYTTVADTENMVFTSQRVAVQSLLYSLGLSGDRGLASTQRVYDETNKVVEFQVQVDLV